MNTIFKQAAVLILTFATVTIWQFTFLSGFTLQIIAVIVVAYLILSAWRRSIQKFKFFERNDIWSIYFIVTFVILLIFATGGLQSMLFFLLYFLCFGVAFVFKPIMVFLFVLLIGAVFFPSAIADDVMGNFLRLGSVLVVSALAFFFGREFKQDEKEQKKEEEHKKQKNK